MLMGWRPHRLFLLPEGQLNFPTILVPSTGTEGPEKFKPPAETESRTPPRVPAQFRDRSSVFVSYPQVSKGTLQNSPRAPMHLLRKKFCQHLTRVPRKPMIFRFSPNPKILTITRRHPCHFIHHQLAVPTALLPHPH